MEENRTEEASSLETKFQEGIFSPVCTPLCKFAEFDHSQDEHPAYCRISHSRIMKYSLCPYHPDNKNK